MNRRMFIYAGLVLLGICIPALWGCGSALFGGGVSMSPAPWRSRTITYRVLDRADRPQYPMDYVRDWGESRALIPQAVAYWNEARVVHLVEVPATDSSAGIDLILADYLVETDQAIGVTYPQPGRPAAYTARARVIVANKARDAFGRSYLLPTLEHELGHALGLGHDANLRSIMYPTADEQSIYRVVRQLDPTRLWEGDRIALAGAYAGVP